QTARPFLRPRSRAPAWLRRNSGFQTTRQTGYSTLPRDAAMETVDPRRRRISGHDPGPGTGVAVGPHPERYPYAPQSRRPAGGVPLDFLERQRDFTAWKTAR